MQIRNGDLIMVITLIVIAYSAWAVYSGWKFMQGRVAYLEQPGVLNKILKALCAILVGYVVGVLQFIALIFKGLSFFTKW